MSAVDPVARRLGLAALACSLLALGLAIYALTMAFQHRGEVRALADVLGKVGAAREVPMTGPPPTLDPDDR